MKVKNNIPNRILLAYPIIIISAVLLFIDIINTTKYFIICGIVFILYIIAIIREKHDALEVEGVK